MHPFFRNFRSGLIVLSLLTASHSVQAQIQWELVAGPTNVRSILVLENGNIYVGRDNGLGVIRSTNGGTNWTTVNMGLILTRPGQTNAVNVLCTNTLGEVVAGLGSGTYQGGGTNGYRLPGNGTTWISSQGLSSSWKISDLTIDTNGYLYAGTAWNGEVWKSTDNGGSYTKIANLSQQSANQGTGSGAIWVVATGPDGSLYAQGELHCGMLRSQDGGATWQDIGLSVAEGYSGNIFAIGFNRFGEVLVNRTDKNGASLHRYTSQGWVASAGGLPSWQNVTSVVGNSSGRLYAGLYNVTSNQIYQSLDDGQTWQPCVTGLPAQIMRLYTKMVMDKNGRLYCAIAGNLYRTIQSTDTIPLSPSSFTAQTASNTSISLSWTDNAINEQGFYLERKIGTGNYALLATLSPNQTSYQDTGLMAGTTYFYRIQTYNGAGNSAYSTPASATTSGSDPYQTWKAGFFTPSELADPTISGDQADPDGDGMDNLKEYISGTHPRNASSRLSVSQLGMTNNFFLLQWQSTASKNYQPQYSSDLTNWTDAGSVFLGTGTTLIWMDDGSFTGGVPGSTSKRFYRVRAF